MQLTNVKRASLLAAMTLTFQYLYGFILQLQGWTVFQRLQWFVVVFYAIDLLLVTPLLALFWILGTTNVTPFLSHRLRYLALIAASVEFLFLTAPRLLRLAHVVNQHPSLGWYSHETVAMGLWSWIKTPWVGAQLSEISLTIAELALALFLITLFRQKKGSEIADQAAQQFARRIAIVALFIGATIVVLDLFCLVHLIAMIFSAARHSTWGTLKSPIQFAWRVTSTLLSRLCWTLTAWIAYRGLTPSIQAPEPVHQPSR